MMKRTVTSVQVTRHANGTVADQEDLLATEEPLEIAVAFKDKEGWKRSSISVTMRTPGHDADLAVGFLYTEGIIKGQGDVKATVSNPENENSITVELNEGCAFDAGRLQRHFYTTSSCGVCGKTSIENVRVQIPLHVSRNDFAVDAGMVMELPVALHRSQVVFMHTGGLHASALFSSDGKLLLLREDVGRHNALDKICGSALASGHMPLNDCILLLSGRASFELIQKAAMCGIPVVAAIGAPSALAVEMAETTGITLLGFLRDNRFNIYTHKHRINK